MIGPGVWVALHYQFASDPKVYNAELFKPLEVAPNSSKDPCFRDISDWCDRRFRSDP